MPTIIKYNNHALWFEKNPDAKVGYRIVALGEATRFDSENEARLTVKMHRIAPPGLVSYHEVDSASSVSARSTVAIPPSPRPSPPGEGELIPASVPNGSADFGLQQDGVFSRPERVVLEARARLGVTVSVAQTASGTWVNGHMALFKRKTDHKQCLALGEQFRSRPAAIVGGIMDVIIWLRGVRGSKVAREKLLQHAKSFQSGEPSLNNH